MSGSKLRFLSLIVLLCACSSDSGAQARKSQLATLTQLVGPARIEIVYRRPVARGRELFGALVPWARVWTPSADSAALISTSTDLTIAGSRLPAGRYAIWMIPDRDSWSVIFSSATGLSPDVSRLQRRSPPRQGEAGNRGAHGDAGLLLSNGGRRLGGVEYALGTHRGANNYSGA